MERNSRTIWIKSANATTPLPWVNNAPDFSGISEPTLSILRLAYESQKDNVEVVADVATTQLVAPNPRGFYDAMVDHLANHPLNGVYANILEQSLDTTKDTSSLLSAMFLVKSALDNDWLKSYALSGFQLAYLTLKPFLSPSQIEIVDYAIIEFNLGG
jgi:hypothetical protein